MPDEASREPVLKDTRDNLERINDLLDRVLEDLDALHLMLDKDLFARKPALAEKKMAEAPPPNLRFDMSKMSNTAIDKLETVLKSLSMLRGKFAAPEPEKVSR